MAICITCGRTFIPAGNSKGIFCNFRCRRFVPYVRKRTYLTDRFWSKVYKTPNCWFWLGTTVNPKQNGYGVLTIEKDGKKCKVVAAHRYSWILHNGPIPDDKVVMHVCDMPQCVNPDHLKLGTRSQNTRDSFAKGRNGNCFVRRTPKLDAERVAAIREAYDAGGSQPQIAKQFGISHTCVHYIVHKMTWAHIE